MRACIEGSETTPTPRSVVLAEYNQLLKEIEASTLTQEEPGEWRRDASYARTIIVLYNGY